MFQKNPSFGNDLDLSSIVTLHSAAEPIQIETKEIFEAAFSDIGLPSTWFGSGYGLAENVAWANALDHFKLSKFAPQEGKPIVAVGHRIMGESPPGQIIKIVSTESQLEVQDGEVGEIWISGPCVAGGYFGKPDLSKDTFEATLPSDTDIKKRRYLRTGDLGFYEDDYLYICGRQKDLIIINGENIYPQDVENVVQNASSGVKPGCIAAFAQSESGFGSELLEIIFEIRKSHEKKCEEVTGSARMAVIEEIGLVPHRIVAIQERTIRKTTSGKIQCRANRAGLHDGSLAKVIVFDLKNHNDDRVKSISDGNQDHSERANDIQKHAQDNTSDDTDIDPEDLCHKVVSSHQDHSERADDMSNHVQDDSSDVSSDDTDIDPEDLYHKVVSSFLGNDVDMDKSWDELGLSSMVSIQLSDALSDHFEMSFDPDSFQKYTTPNLMRGYVLGFDGVPLKISLPALGFIPSKLLSWKLCGPIQFICSVLLLLLFSLSLLPTIGLKYAPLTLPLVIPAWMAFFSMFTVILKWIVIWKYKEGVSSVNSVMYLRWWFVDRAVDLWEFWIGRFIKDTPLINLFYFLMGVKIHRSAKVDAFIREFDLVEVGPGSSLEYPIGCHKFRPANKDSSTPSIRFRSISVGNQCKIKGMVSLGSTICDGAVVEKLSVVPEGAVAPANTRVRGNPSYVMSEGLEPPNQQCWWKSGIIKITWLAFELYLFFGIMLLAQHLWVFRLPSTWRYAPLLKWVLLVLWFGMISVGTSIVFKWILIGKRKPGPYRDTLLRAMADWAADWHYGASTSILLAFTSHSRIWNIILMMHGMDVDFKSKILGLSFLPSQMDLVKVRSSFISESSFNTKQKGGMYRTIEVVESSVGFFAHSESGTDMKIGKAIIAPLTHVTKNIIHQKLDERFNDLSMWKVLRDEILAAFGYCISFGLFVMTLVPSYEVFSSLLTSSGYTWMVVPALATALALQMLSWTILLAFMQSIVQLGAKDNGSPWSNAIYAVFLTASFAHQNWSCIRVFHGSLAYNFLVCMMGAKFEGCGRAILLPRNVYEYAFIQFADQTIVDNAHLRGHFVVYGSVILGPSRVSGVIHEGSYIANALVVSDGNESGPGRSFVGTYDDKMNLCESMGIDTTAEMKMFEQSSHVNEDDPVQSVPMFPILSSHGNSSFNEELA